MSGAIDTSFLKSIRGSLKGAAVLLILDVVMMLGGIFSLVVCPIWCLGAVLRTAFHPNELLTSGARAVAFARIVIPVVTLALVLGNTRLQWRMADANSQKIIQAVERYRANNGTYPKKLDDLVPEYLRFVPPAWYVFATGFRYYANNTVGHSLMWTPNLIWSCVYYFEQAHRSCHDL